MSKKKRKVKAKDPQYRPQAMPWLESEGLHAFVPESAPLPDVLDDMTRRYQQEIRNSPVVG